MTHILIPVLIAMSAAILSCFWLSWQMLQQNGRTLLRLEELEGRLHQLEFGDGDERAGLPLGSPAPEFELPDLNGELRTLTEFRGQSLLLIFFNPACGFCRELTPRLAEMAIRRQRAGGHTTRVSPASTDPLPLIITSGDRESNLKFFAEEKMECSVLLQHKMDVSAVYGASGTPSGYLIDSEGKIASELAAGSEMLLALANEKVESGKSKRPFDKILGVKERANRFGNGSLADSKIERNGLKAGTPAPDFRLPRLDARGELSLAELRGRRVLLVFSNPHCGPCNQLTPKLEQFHLDQPELEIVMVSKGDLDENRLKVIEHGLTFPVVLQKRWEVRSIVTKR